VFVYVFVNSTLSVCTCLWPPQHAQCLYVFVNSTLSVCACLWPLQHAQCLYTCLWIARSMFVYVFVNSTLSVCIRACEQHAQCLYTCLWPPQHAQCLYTCLWTARSVFVRVCEQHAQCLYVFATTTASLRHTLGLVVCVNNAQKMDCPQCMSLQTVYAHSKMPKVIVPLVASTKLLNAGTHD